MSIPIHALIADPSEGPKIAKADDLGRWQGARVEVSDQINLAALWAILECRLYDVANLDHFKTVATGSQESGWLIALPPQLLSQLAQLTDADLPALALRWIEVPVVKEREFYEPAFAENLTTLHRLASKAVEAQKALLVLISI